MRWPRDANHLVNSTTECYQRRGERYSLEASTLSVAACRDMRLFPGNAGGLELKSSSQSMRTLRHRHLY
jgi:hypothetical protein